MIQLLTETATEATVLVSIALLCLITLRRAPARLRALVLGVTLTGTLLLPAAGMLLPQVAVPVPWLSESAPAPSPVATTLAPQPIEAPRTAPTVIDSERPQATVRSAHTPATVTTLNIDVNNAMLMLWLLGAAAALVHLATGWIRALRLVRTARPVDVDTQVAEHWVRVRRQLGLSRVRLGLSDQLSTPATWGCLRPIVLLPTSATGWDPEAIEVALLHEAIHVSRGDWIVRTAARIACAMHWFNPLVWWATRRLTMEQELACDDAIVAHGSRPSTYAAHLLAIAHRAAPRPAVLAAALGMANRTQLEERIMSILNDRPSRRLSVTVIVAVTALSAALVPAIAAIAPTAPRPHVEVDTTEAIPGVPPEAAAVAVPATAAAPVPAAVAVPAAGAAPAAVAAPSAAAAPAPAPREPEAPEPAPRAVPASPELRALSARIRELGRRIDVTVDDAAWSRDMERIIEEMEPYHEHIEAIQEQMEPYTEELERMVAEISAEMSFDHDFDFDFDHEVSEQMSAKLARMSEEIARLSAEIARSVSFDTRDERHAARIEAELERHREALSRRSEELQAHIESMVQPAIEAAQRMNEERMEVLHERIAELHERMLPATESLHELELDMAPLHEQIEQMERELEPLTDEIERLSEQLEQELGAEIRSRLLEHLGPSLGPAAPVDEAVARILDESRIQIHDDRVTMRAHRREVEEILTDLLADDRIGGRDAFERAVERAVNAVSRIDLQL